MWSADDAFEHTRTRCEVRDAHVRACVCARHVFICEAHPDDVPHGEGDALGDLRGVGAHVMEPDELAAQLRACMVCGWRHDNGRAREPPSDLHVEHQLDEGRRVRFVHASGQGHLEGLQHLVEHLHRKRQAGPN